MCEDKAEQAQYRETNPTREVSSSRYEREAFELEYRARKLRRYAELVSKYPEFEEFVELYYEIKMNNAKLGAGKIYRS